jgi:SAM-dependent methyltransferase
MPVAPTFRDPEGFCVTHANRVLRVIHPEAVERVRALLDSEFVAGLMAAGEFPATRALAPAEIDELGSVAALRPTRESRPALVLEHERIAFVSYPHEWCPEMLFAAGELTLELQLRALEAGMSLKDATPSNVLFRDGRPVFVDLLSFAPRVPGQSVWPAYAQFVRTFLLPLLLHRELGVPTHDLFLARRDGLEPEEAYGRLSMLGRLRPSVLQHVSIPTWLGRLSSAKEPAPAKPAAKNDEHARMVLGMVVRGLRRSFRRLRPRSLLGSAWSDYMATSNYQDAAFKAKEAFVKAALDDLAPRTVLDVGCNTGHFSLLAGSRGASVVALDYDPVVVGRLWGKVSAERSSILPLVLNLARPSPGLGWRNDENASFLARAEQRFDVALLLAVVHHLTVTDGVSLPEVFRLMAEIVTKGLVVEFIPPTDSMFRRIIRNKEHLVPKLQQADFEAAFGTWFEPKRVEAIPESGRVLYCLTKKTG